MNSPMQSLEHKIPPPIVVMIVAGLMVWGAHGTPALVVDARLRIATAAALVLAGLLVTAAGAMAFRRAKTTINPLQPDAASSLVVTGIYRHTRNPMYVGFTAMLLGLAAYLAAPWLLLGPLGFAWFTTRFQIVPEERVLSAKFGAAFDQYRADVRRWI